MSKKKLKAKIKKLRAQVAEARASAVAQQIARMLFSAATGDANALPKEREGEPPVIGALRRAAEAASKIKAKP